MRAAVILASFAAACATSAPAQDAAPPFARSMGEILEQAPAADWRPLDPENTLYLDFAGGRVVIELAPDFAPGHVANLKALARAHYFDDAAVVRAQDNYVVQWSQPEETRSIGAAQRTLPAEFQVPIQRALPFTALADPDTYAPHVGFAAGMPSARDERDMWLTHCYGMLGAGRDVSPDSGGGAELYVVIGQSPRHLDRNVTLFGRVVQGIEMLSVLPRGTGDLGFYLTPEERTPIRSIRVAADVPAAERTNLETLRTDSASFAALIASRRSRREEWFATPTDRIGVCNVPLPVRAVR